MRAIETRMTVIRPGNTGISAVIDPYGMVTARLDLNVRGRLDAEVPLTDAFPERSFYVRHGDWFGSISMVLFASALLRASSPMKPASSARPAMRCPTGHDFVTRKFHWPPRPEGARRLSRLQAERISFSP